MTTVTWQPKALKQLKKLGDKAVQGRILAATAALSAFPDVANVKALTGHEYGYRLRVFFNALAAISIVRIEEVKKRDERTY
jgi:mRNA-degrading endonuclease RelE of RelBE toxin-antitoxin system